MCMEKDQYKRCVAQKARIKDMLDGEYVKENGWTPNYIITPNNEKVSRVNLIGVLVSMIKDEASSYQTMIIDDGSAKISVRNFDGNISRSLSIGDIVLIIGRPREYNTERYISSEIIRKVTDSRWLDVRKHELDQRPTLPSIKPSKQEKTSSSSPEERFDTKDVGLTAKELYNTIREFDNGSGADFNVILEKYKDNKTEELINYLLEEGEIFEVSPGKLKVLE